jgi:RNA polymerase sigma-70 factor (ECF subfamily)
VTVLSSYSTSLAGPYPGESESRLRGMVAAHFEAMWRLLRRLGVPPSDLDDAVQEVILVLARRMDTIEKGSERAFVLSTAYRVASTVRRTLRRRPRTVEIDEIDVAADSERDPEAMLNRRRAREMLDSVLSALPIELRAIFVLYELERLTMADIAQTLGLAPGTVASRLRRARALFQERVAETERGFDLGDRI